MAYDINDSIRCSAEFKNSSGTYIDPTTIIFKLKMPDGTKLLYTYGIDSELIKESTGKYYISEF